MSGITKDLRKCLQLIVINKQTQKLTFEIQDKIANKSFYIDLQDIRSAKIKNGVVIISEVFIIIIRRPPLPNVTDRYRIYPLLVLQALPALH